MGAPPPDTHTETKTTQASHQQQQAPPPATMVSDSSSPGSGSQRGRTCNHQGCIRRGFDRCTWGQPQPSGTATQTAATNTMNPPRGGGWYRGGRGGGGRGGMLGYNRQGPTPYDVDPAPAATAADVVDTVKKEDVDTKPQPQTWKRYGFKFPPAQDSTTAQTQTGSLAQKPVIRLPPAPGTWRSTPRIETDGQYPQLGQAPRVLASNVQMPAGGPGTDTSKMYDIGNQSQPKAADQTRATTTKAPAFGGIAGAQNPSKAPESNQSASQVTSNTNSTVPASSSGTGTAATKNANSSSGMQAQTNDSPGLSIPAGRASNSTSDTQNSGAPACKTQTAPGPSPNEQSFQAATSDPQASGAMAQSAGGPVSATSDTTQSDNNTQLRPEAGSRLSHYTSNAAPWNPGCRGPESIVGPATKPSQDSAPIENEPQMNPAPTAAPPPAGGALSANKRKFDDMDTQPTAFSSSAPSVDALSSSSWPLSGSFFGQTQPAMAFGACHATASFLSSSPAQVTARPSFAASFSRGASIAPENGITTRNPIVFGATQLLPNPALFGVKSEGTSFGRASEPPPALNGNSRESQGPPRKRFKYDSTILVLVGADEDEFTVHKDVIIRRSSYFKSQCSSNTQPAERCVRLPGIEPEVFDCYLQWIYHSDIVFPAAEDSGNAPGAQEAESRTSDCFTLVTAKRLFLAKLYVLAGFLGDIKLKNAATDNFMNTISRGPFQKDFGESGFGAAFINYLWSNTTPLDNFRQAVLDESLMLSAGLRMGEWLQQNKDELHVEFMKDIAVRLAKEKPEGKFIKVGKCAYHEHNEENPPCA